MSAFSGLAKVAMVTEGRVASDQALAMELTRSSPTGVEKKGRKGVGGRLTGHKSASQLQQLRKP